MSQSARARLRPPRHGGVGPCGRHARRYQYPPARRQSGGRHGGRLRGARRRGRAGDLDRRRLLSPVSRGRERPQLRSQRLGRGARPGDTGGFSRRHEYARAARQRGSGTGPRLGRDASALRPPAVEGFVRSGDRARARPSGLQGAGGTAAGESRRACGRSGLRGALPAAGARGRDRRNIAAARACGVAAGHRPAGRRRVLSRRSRAAHRAFSRSARRAHPGRRSRRLCAALGRADRDRLPRPPSRGHAAQFLRHPAVDAAQRALGARQRDPDRIARAPARLPDQRHVRGLRRRAVDRRSARPPGCGRAPARAADRPPPCGRPC